MPIRFTFIEKGQERLTTFEGVATISENPPMLTLMATDEAWEQLVSNMNGAMIMAVALETVEQDVEDKSRLYLKGEEDRERITDYEFVGGYKAKDVVRQTTSTKTTLIKQPKLKEKPAVWMWSGNKHGH